MGKRKKASRRKSSDSDSEGLALKQSRHDQKLDSSISNAISDANSVLYECEAAEDTHTSISQTDSLKSPISRKTESAMATGTSGSRDLQAIREQISQVLTTVIDIKRSQESMRVSFDSKLDKMINEFIATIDGNMRVLRNEISIDINRESNRIDQLVTNIETLQTRLDTVEERVTTPTPGDEDVSEQHQNNLNDPDMCVIVSGLSFQEDENLTEKVDNLIRALGEDVSSNVTITGTVRLKSRYPDRPAYVKISFRSSQEKVLVLRTKNVLKDINPFKNVYIKSSKSHTERLIELNARMVLRHLPQGNNFRVDANGRIRARQIQGNENRDG